MNTKPNLAKDRITDGMGITKAFSVPVKSLDELKRLNPSMPDDLLAIAWEKLKGDRD